MSPTFTAAASMVPPDEEVMAYQMRDPAAVWSVQVEAPKAADGMNAETAVKKMKRDAKRRVRTFIARKNCATPRRRPEPISFDVTGRRRS